MPDFTVPDLKLQPREGGYVRGQEGLGLILKAALSVLVEHGYQALTLRRIATECGMKAGNISYYFKSKDDLVRALLDAVMSSYEDAFDVAMNQAGADPERRLENLIRLILEDITTKKTTHVFPELWALANHDPFVKERVDELYAREHVFFEDLIYQLNPALPADERRVVAMFITASLEGLTVFAGFGKLWEPSMPNVEAIACRCFVQLVKTLKPGDSHAFAVSSSPVEAKKRGRAVPNSRSPLKARHTA